MEKRLWKGDELVNGEQWVKDCWYWYTLWQTDQVPYTFFYFSSSIFRTSCAPSSSKSILRYYKKERLLKYKWKKKGLSIQEAELSFQGQPATLFIFQPEVVTFVGTARSRSLNAGFAYIPYWGIRNQNVIISTTINRATRESQRLHFL